MTRVIPLVAATAAMAITALLSAVPWTPADAGRSFVRLSWRATGTLIEECRQPDEEENARLPAHMRRDEICEGRTASFLLAVSIDGRTVLHDTLEATGARGDRPVYVIREVEVAPGPHDLEVTFDTLLPGSAGRTSTRTGGFPEHLRLETRLDPGAGDIILVTYDAERRTLVTRSQAADG